MRLGRWLAVLLALLAWCLARPGRAETPWRAGLARAKITPERSMPMIGYGPRMSDGVLDDLYAKALALESADGQRAVLLTADLCFFRTDVAEEAARRIIRKTGLERRQILLSASHTHSGPIMGMNKDLESFSVPSEFWPRVDAYTQKVQDQLADLAAAALADLKPARLSWGAGRSDLPMNRRVKTAGGVGMAPNPAGPVDRDVPVLRIDAADGRLRAVVFGCACHPVTLTGENRKFSGDYVSYAQQEIERRWPGAQAMFTLGCAADANSEPRGSAEIARKQGEGLAAEVCRVASGPLAPVRGPLRTELQWTALPLEHSLPRDRLQQIAGGGSPWHARSAKAMLELLHRGAPLPSHYRSPIGLWQFGGDLTLVSLPGEPVADYASRLQKVLAPRRLWIIGYANESFGYLPTAKILEEGGHESMSLTLGYGLFSPQVEETVLAKVKELAGKTDKNRSSSPIAVQQAEQGKPVPAWVVYPGEQWSRITPEQAGLDAAKLKELVAKAGIHGGGFGGVQVKEGQWGAVLTRGGYLVESWGDPSYKFQSASLGKCIMRALVGLTAEAGLVDLDEPIWKTWTGRGQLSHPHKCLDEGLHRLLTWRYLLEHQGGFVLESGFHWRNKTLFHAVIPEGVRWTGDPLVDNFAQTPPGAATRYSSAGYWRLSQALTALWGRDLKEVLDERLFRHLGIPADRWQWTPGKEVHDTKDFYPDFPNYGEYVDPPYEIGGRVVRGGPGWMRISSEDLARFGLLVATGGVWKGKRLIGPEWLRGHAGLDIHVVAGDPETLVSIAKINTKDFPFGAEVGTQGRFRFPKELVVGPVMGAVQRSEPKYEVTVQRNVRIPMRDGVALAGDLYLPQAPGPFPTLMQLRYYPAGAGEAQFFARHGYAAILVDSRGRGGSDGQWDPYVNEPRDGYDAQQWIGRQPWSNGKIGMFGQSYNAFTQIMTAPLASPHLKCIFPLEGQQTCFGHLYNDGVLQLNVVFTFGLFSTGKGDIAPHRPIHDPFFRQLPLMAAADQVPHPQAQRIKTWVRHARYDDYWKSYGVKEKYPQVQVPAYFASGWYDNLIHENWRNFEGFRKHAGSEAARRGTKIRIGPGVHGASGADLDLHLRWYDYWLKGRDTGIDREPPIRIYVMGADRWRDEQEWPLARTRFTPYYLQSGGRANSLHGDGRLVPGSTLPRPEGEPGASGVGLSKDTPPDRFTYDPENPVYTMGGQMSTNVEVWGPKDRRALQERDDVLVYTTGPLAEDTEVTGPVELKLYASSSAVDTDFTATLTDVHPDGRAIHICEGILGVTYRDSLEDPTPIEPGRVYPLKISLWETSMVFKAGHRIRLEVSSSNFPRYARNQNTGLPLGTSAEVRKAQQTIHHDAKRPSQLVLPILPATKR